MRNIVLWTDCVCMARGAAHPNQGHALRKFDAYLDGSRMVH